MPPAALHHLILQALALLAAAAVVGWINRPAPRVLIPHEGRVLPVVASSALMAASMSAILALGGTWPSYIAGITFVIGAGFLVHTSVRWDSFSAVATQAATTWTTFGLWMFGTNLVHSIQTGAAFWRPWNTSIFPIELIVAAFFGLLQIVAIRGARTHARHGRWIQPPTGAASSAG